MHRNTNKWEIVSLVRSSITNRTRFCQTQNKQNSDVANTRKFQWLLFRSLLVKLIVKPTTKVGKKRKRRDREIQYPRNVRGKLVAKWEKIVKNQWLRKTREKRGLKEPLWRKGSSVGRWGARESTVARFDSPGRRWGLWRRGARALAGPLIPVP